ncbi:MAG: right-handed parallel beta-helix repeat-containing protein, partial [Melioribacteraceae bacterium]|nr:right-handed parallel beta-helix repeat-containing protein [Melioribacteraceae bacterium]
EDLSDWMSYHDNEEDQWLSFGAAIYIKNCDSLIVRDCLVNEGQCALMITSSDYGLIYNNNFSFNSAIGIGMYRSSFNRVMHNKLDWNVRGYSHGIYRRGQDSAGILVYEQCTDNIFAYNSATHSGDGFFLWAGNSTMDSGEGGCNRNIIYRNDFSHAPTNGVEVTFSSNKIIENLLNDCRYGIWGGYSYSTEMKGNQIKNNEFGIAIEHGQDNIIESNYFSGDSIGIQLWERATQPAGWGFARKRNVESKNYSILNNKLDVITPFHINSTSEIQITGNEIVNGDRSIAGKGNIGLEVQHAEDVLELLASKLNSSNLIPGNNPDIPMISDGMNPFLPATHPRGVKYILMNEWGPYNFKYPAIFLSHIEEEKMTLSLFGPEGNWKVVNSEGFSNINPTTGSFPSQISALRIENANSFSLHVEFIGASFTDQLGIEHERGVPYTLQFKKYIHDLNWQVIWCDYPERLNPINDYDAFKELKERNISMRKTVKELAFRWWRGPGEGIHPDRFASFAEASSEFEKGVYRIQITSDDGLRFYVDGALKIDHWDIHVPATDEIEIELDGSHHFEIHHFEGGGLATLDFRMEKVE